MSARFELHQIFDHPAPIVIALLTDPGFLERKARNFGATEAKATRTERGDEVVVVIDVWEPARFGGGTDRRTMTQTSDPITGAGKWVQILHGMQDRSTAEGSSEVRVLGPNRCEVISRGLIEIRIPLMGKVIERKVVEAVEAGSTAEQRYIAAELAKVATSG